MHSTLEELLHRARRAPSPEAYAEDLLETVQAHVESDVLTFHHVRWTSPVATRAMDAGVLESCRHRWPVFDRELAPVLERAAQGDGVAIDRDVYGAKRDACSYYTELVAPQRGGVLMLAPLGVAGRTIAVVGLGRRRRPFTRAAQRALASWVSALSLATAAVMGAGSPFASASLTPAERDLVDYVRLGLTNREIATARGTSPNTTRNQLFKLFEKVGVSNRTELVGRLTTW